MFETTASARSPRGQRVEYQQRRRAGESLAESAARVVVSGRVVARGWSCDGATWREYERIVREGWTS